MLFDWSREFQVGVAEIDAQHERLVALINQLHEELARGRANAMLGGLFAELTAYTTSHFATEEAFMQKYDYPGRKHHAAEHAALTRKAIDLQQKFSAGGDRVSFETSAFLRDWLSHHIQGIDRALGAYLAAQGVK